MPRAPRTPEPAPRQRGGKSYTVTLAGGGTLAVTLNVDPFTLAGADRTFVFDIVDKVTGYGKTNGKAAKPVNLGPKQTGYDPDSTEGLADAVKAGFDTPSDQAFAGVDEPHA